MHTKGTIEVPELVLKHFKIDKTILYLNYNSTFVLETAPEGFTRSNSFCCCCFLHQAHGTITNSL